MDELVCGCDRTGESTEDETACEVCCAPLCRNCRACDPDCTSGRFVCAGCAAVCLLCNAKTCAVRWCPDCGQAFACCGCWRDAQCECEIELEIDIEETD